MRLSLFILGVRPSSAPKDPQRRKTIRGAPITILTRAVPRIAGSQHFNNAWRP
jgi:hypothetical protein